MTKKVNWYIKKAKNWKNLTAPARPWPSEVAWFEKYVLDKKKEGKKDVLILGSTVEFRSMLHQHKMNVHVVDFSSEFYRILSKQHMDHEGREIFYKQNWLTMNLGKKFDLIFGDWVFGVLNPKDYDNLLKSVAKHLKPGGYFIVRQPVLLADKPMDIDKVAREHYKKYAGKYSFYESSAHHVYHYRPSPKTRINDNLDITREALKKAYQFGLLRQKDYNFFIKALSFESGTISVFLKKELESKIKKYFKIITEHHGKEASSPWFPIYVMSRKGKGL